MELNGVDVFVKVVQLGSFSQAARALGMPNTTVSAKVAGLERRLGVTLIQRTTRKLHVTQAGEIFFKRCVKALEELRAAREEVSVAQTHPRGILKITSAVDVAHGLLVPLVDAYLAKYPDVNVELIVTNRVVDLVGEGIDLAFRGGELEDSSLVARKILPVNIVLWASKNYLKQNGEPKTPKDLAKHMWVSPTMFDGRELSLTNTLQTRVRVPIQSRVGVDDFETLKKLVLLGRGVGPIPQFMCEEEARKGLLVQVLPQWSVTGSSHFSLVYPAQRFVPSHVRAFIEMASTAF